MSARYRSKWLDDPRIRALYEERSKPGEAPSKRSSTYARVERAVQKSAGSVRDSVRLSDDGLRLEWDYVGVDLLGQNVLMRCHQAKVNAYRKGWEKRTADLVWSSKPLIRAWAEKISYPLRYEVIYLTSHSQLMDEDNLISSSKFIVDAIVRNTPVPDDKPEFLRFPVVESIRAKESRLLIALFAANETLLSAESIEWLRRNSPS